MSPYERAADRWDANARSRKQARARRARHAQLMADIAFALSAADAALAGIPDGIVRTPQGTTTIVELTGCIAMLRRRLERSARLPVTSIELAAALEAVLADDGPCSTKVRDERPAAFAARRLLERWNGHGTDVRRSPEPPGPATTKERT